MNLPIDNACCPICWHNHLDWIHEAAVCPSCAARFPLAHGLWYAVVPDISWKAVLQDTVALFMDFTANRDAANEARSRAMQQTQETYARDSETERDAGFDETWSTLNIPTSASILEIGAGDLRTASRLTRMGYGVVASEPVPEFLRRGYHDHDLDIQKVCCSATRLPFRKGSFDVVYCQTMLHHVENIAAVVREMARVLRPGGRLLIFNEPVSAMFRSERRARETTPDFSYDIGANENMPYFTGYCTPVIGTGCIDINAYARPELCRLPHRLRRFGFLRGLLPQSQCTRGWRMHLRHRFTNGEVSLAATRDATPIPNPPRAADPPPFDAEDYIFRRDRKHLMDIWRGLLEFKDIPGGYYLGANDLEGLRRGFSRRETDSDDLVYKWLQSQGSFFLKVCPEDKFLLVSLKQPDPNQPINIRARINTDAPLEPVDGFPQALANGWQAHVWRVPPIPKPVICDFLLNADRVHDHDGMPVSVKILRIELLETTERIQSHFP